MVQRQFFGPSWINKVIEFDRFDASPAKAWKIVRKINEKNDQGGEADWEDFDHTPMMAFALFECANSVDPSERAFMKIYMQIPYTESEGFFPAERAEQASPEEKISEEIALRTLTKLGCESSPRLLNYKREYQNDYQHVPGGFIVYLVTGKLPGVLLSPEEYWEFADGKRQEIREAFKKAYEDCVGFGIVPVQGVLGTNLLWDETQKKIYFVSFEDCCKATTEDAWGSHIWLGWGFAELRREVSNIPHPLPPNVLPDGKINQTLWKL